MRRREKGEVIREGESGRREKGDVKGRWKKGKGEWVGIKKEKRGGKWVRRMRQKGTSRK